jgi:hypothetical protein
MITQSSYSPPGNKTISAPSLGGVKCRKKRRLVSGSEEDDNIFH